MAKYFKSYGWELSGERDANEHGRKRPTHLIPTEYLAAYYRGYDRAAASLAADEEAGIQEREQANMRTLGANGWTQKKS